MRTESGRTAGGFTIAGRRAASNRQRGHAEKHVSPSEKLFSALRNLKGLCARLLPVSETEKRSAEYIGFLGSA
jgi:hypothetical protein